MRSEAQQLQLPPRWSARRGAEGVRDAPLGSLANVNVTLQYVICT